MLFVRTIQNLYLTGTSKVRTEIIRVFWILLVNDFDHQNVC